MMEVTQYKKKNVSKRKEKFWVEEEEKEIKGRSECMRKVKIQELMERK